MLRVKTIFNEKIPVVVSINETTTSTVMDKTEICDKTQIKSITQSISERPKYKTLLSIFLASRVRTHFIVAFIHTEDKDSSKIDGVRLFQHTHKSIILYHGTHIQCKKKQKTIEMKIKTRKFIIKHISQITIGTIIAIIGILINLLK